MVVLSRRRSVVYRLHKFLPCAAGNAVKGGVCLCACAGDLPAGVSLRSFELHGKTVGIIGYGRIGHAVARLALAFGMRVVCNDTVPRPVAGGVEPLALARLLAESDVVVLACGLARGAPPLMDAMAISAMRAGALLINVSRSDLVDNAAVLAAIVAGQLRGYAVDDAVFDAAQLARVEHGRIRVGILMRPWSVVPRCGWIILWRWRVAWGLGGCGERCAWCFVGGVLGVGLCQGLAWLSLMFALLRGLNPACGPRPGHSPKGPHYQPLHPPKKPHVPSPVRGKVTPPGTEAVDRVGNRRSRMGVECPMTVCGARNRTVPASAASNVRAFARLARLMRCGNRISR